MKYCDKGLLHIEKCIHTSSYCIITQHFYRDSVVHAICAPMSPKSYPSNVISGVKEGDKKETEGVLLLLEVFFVLVKIFLMGLGSNYS